MCCYSSALSIPERLHVVFIVRHRCHVSLCTRQCQRLFRQFGFSLRKTETFDCQRERRRSGPGQKDCAGWQKAKALTSGQWMKFTSNSTDRDAGCGFRLKPRILCSCSIRQERALDTSALYVCAMGSWSKGGETNRVNAETCFTRDGRSANHG